MTRPPRPRLARSLRSAVGCVLAAELGVLVGFKTALWAESVEAVRRSAAYLGLEDPYPLVPPALVDALQRADVVAVCAYAVALVGGIVLLPAWPDGLLGDGSKRLGLAGMGLGFCSLLLEVGSQARLAGESILWLLVGLGLPMLLAGEAGARGARRLRATWLLVAGLSPLPILASICLRSAEGRGSEAVAWSVAIYAAARVLALAWTWRCAERAPELALGRRAQPDLVDW